MIRACTIVVGRGRDARQADRKRAAAPFLTLDRDGPAVERHNLLHNVQPDPHAANIIDADVAGPVESLEEVWQVVRWNTNPLVLNRNADYIVLCGDADRNRAAVRAVLHG